MTRAELTGWMNSMGLNKTEAAIALGIARNTLLAFLKGRPAILPIYIELACEALTARKKAASEAKR